MAPEIVPALVARLTFGELMGGLAVMTGGMLAVPALLPSKALHSWWKH